MAERFEDIHAIIQVSLAYAGGIDHRDWERFRGVFHDDCHFDTSSWSGRAPSVMRADDWVHAVRSVNGSFDATQHLMTNHVIAFEDDDVAIGVNEMQAQHWFSAESMQSMQPMRPPAHAAWCVLGGHYRNRYTRVDGVWRMAAMQLVVRWHSGDQRVFALARGPRNVVD